MKFENDSSVTIENSGSNMGVQVGHNSGNITIHQDIPSDRIDDLAQSIALKVAEQCQNDNSPLGSASTKTKWFRADTGKEITSDELLKQGNITAQIDGNVARAEFCLSDGQAMYAEFNMENNQISNIVSKGFPQEYSICVPEEIQIRVNSFRCKIGAHAYNAKYYELKFGGYLICLYDVNTHTLQEIFAKAPAGMKTFTNPIKKEITFVKNECVHMSSN